MTPAVRALIVTHGELGGELIRTIEAILGPQEGVACLSNAGASLDGLSERIRAELAAGQPLVVFVDLMGGSCGHACRGLPGPATRVVSGVNLPMLLDFFINRERVAFEPLVERITAKGREGIHAL